MSARLKMENIMVWLIMGVLLMAMIWAFMPFPITHVDSLSLAKEPIFCRGDTVNMKLGYSKYLPVIGDVSRLMIKQDDPNKGLEVTIIAGRPGNILTGNKLEAISSFVIPVTSPPGKYIMRSTESYPGRFVYDCWDTPVFTVTESYCK